MFFFYRRKSNKLVRIADKIKDGKTDILNKKSNNRAYFVLLNRKLKKLKKERDLNNAEGSPEQIEEVEHALDDGLSNRLDDAEELERIQFDQKRTTQYKDRLEDLKAVGYSFTDDHRAELLELCEYIADQTVDLR